jgi:hypothetical protein
MILCCWVNGSQCFEETQYTPAVQEEQLTNDKWRRYIHMVCWVSGWLRRLVSQLGRHGTGMGFIHCLDKADRCRPSTSNQPTNRLTGSELVIWYTQCALHHLTKHSSGQYHQSLCSNDVNYPIARSPQTICPCIHERAGTEWRYVQKWGRCMGSVKCPPEKCGASLSELQNKQNSNFKMHVTYMFIKVLSTSWFKLCTYIYTQAILVQSG